MRYLPRPEKRDLGPGSADPMESEEQIRKSREKSQFQKNSCAYFVNRIPDT
jgi:hypothetical protein